MLLSAFVKKKRMRSSMGWQYPSKVGCDPKMVGKWMRASTTESTLNINTREQNRNIEGNEDYIALPTFTMIFILQDLWNFLVRTWNLLLETSVRVQNPGLKHITDIPQRVDKSILILIKSRHIWSCYQCGNVITLCTVKFTKIIRLKSELSHKRPVTKYSEEHRILISN